VERIEISDLFRRYESDVASRSAMWTIERRYLPDRPARAETDLRRTATPGPFHRKDREHHVAEPAGAAPSPRPRTSTTDLVVQLAVLTVVGAHGPVGRTVGALIGDDGASVVVLLPADRSLAGAAAAEFRLSVLPDDGESVADAFAGGGSDFPGTLWEPESESGPALRDAVATFACTTTVVHPIAGGFVLIGETRTASALTGRSPLLRSGGTYRRVEEPPLSVFPQFADEVARDRTPVR
jgi:hypothetical protein